MYINKGLGVAAVDDSYLAGKKAAEMAHSQNPSPHIAIMFASSEYEQEEVVRGAVEILGKIPLFGSSSYYEISNVGFMKKSVVILLLSSDVIEFKMFSARCEGAPELAASSLISDFQKNSGYSPGDKTTCILLADESHLNGIKYLDGIRSAFGGPLPICGGGSGGDIKSFDKFFNGFQYFNGAVTSDSMGILFIKALVPDAVGFGYAFESSWSPIARPVICTKTDKNVVYEVDGIPVLKYLKSHLGENFIETMNETRYKYSFISSVKDGIAEKNVVRTPGIIDNNAGSITFFPAEDMQGMKLQPVQLSRDELIDSARRAAVKAKESLGDLAAEAVFVFSCHLRNRILHSRTDEEIAMIRDVFGDDVPIIGFYCAGEYAPNYNAYDDVVDPARELCGSRQLSTSISIMAIGSKILRDPESVIDYGDIFKKHLADTKVLDTNEKSLRKIVQIARLLDNAEQIISETEKAFKYINNEHYNLSIKLEQKNMELMKANERNEKLQEVIRQHTPHTVWKKAHLSVDAGRYEIPDEEINCTLMFLDIKGFTTYAEKHSPAEVIGRLNKIFAPATDIIYKNGGDIDKFIGDCIFCTFESSSAALRAASEIQKKLKRAGSEGFTVRIGINTGRVISGNVGGKIRRDNTLIGDAVNMAQRLEANCSPGAVLLSSSSFDALDRELLKDCAVVEKTIKVKGREEAVKVFEIFINA